VEEHGYVASNMKPVWSSPNSLVKELRSYLEEKLPSYMLPTGIVVLESLPLTSHGKLDLRALPAPRPVITNTRPRTPREQVLCELVAEVLSLDEVGIDDDFFALGGHSLTAMRLISRVRSTLQMDLAIHTVFEEPTVAKMAAALTECKTARASLVRRPRPGSRN
jgi:acyl carrier protein